MSYISNLKKSEVRKRGTYLVEFVNGDTIIFGNNYKPWYTHASEYALRHFRDVSAHLIAKQVKFSPEPFADDGGLAWCSTDVYQDVIDEVSKNEGVVYTPFEDMIFKISNKDLDYLDKQIERW